MSIKVLSHIWQTAEVSGSKLLVLLALADFANDDGGSIYPSMITIAAKARLSEKQTRRVIHDLIDGGHIELVHDGGWDGKRNMANEYRIVLGGTPKLSPPPSQDVPTVLPNREGGGPAHGTTVVPPMGDQSSYNRHSEETDHDDDNACAREADPELSKVLDAWSANVPGTLTPILLERLTDLTDECGAPAVCHGITAAVENGARNFKYIAACARNHAAGKEAPQKQTTQRNGYHNSLRPNRDGYYDFLSTADAREALAAHPEIKGRITIKGTKTEVYLRDNT